MVRSVTKAVYLVTSVPMKICKHALVTSVIHYSGSSVLSQVMMCYADCTLYVLSMLMAQVDNSLHSFSTIRNLHISALVYAGTAHQPMGLAEAYVHPHKWMHIKMIPFSWPRIKVHAH